MRKSFLPSGFFACFSLFNLEAHPSDNVKLQVPKKTFPPTSMAKLRQDPCRPIRAALFVSHLSLFSKEISPPDERRTDLLDVFVPSPKGPGSEFLRPSARRAVSPPTKRLFVYFPSDTAK